MLKKKLQFYAQKLCLSMARFFLLVDLQEKKNQIYGQGGEKKINKKALKMTSDVVIFRAFFFFFFF